MNFYNAVELTWDQALFSFRFENYILAGKVKRKESLIQTFYETSAAHFFDWLTFAESTKKVGGRRFVGLYQALFSFPLARRNVNVKGSKISLYKLV